MNKMNEMDEKEKGRCAICLDRLLSVDRVVGLSCCHTLHAECAEEHIRSGQLTRCPVCRTVISDFTVCSVTK